MSLHIGAKKGEIAERIMLPGDPMRAKYIADNFLEDAKCYNEVRGMLGFTGKYKGSPISVQGTGMGLPSAAIYISELISEYGCTQLMRIGTCGAYLPEIKLLDVIMAQGACTDSSFNKAVFADRTFAPIADFSLLHKAYIISQTRENKDIYHVGNILSSDRFYHDPEHTDSWEDFARYGVLGVEMEAAALYSLAALNKVQALAIFSVSDNLVTGELTSSETREKALNDMITLALDTLLP